MLNVLEHIKDDCLAIKNTFKLLNKNGTIYIEVPAMPFLFDNYDRQLLHFRRYSMVDLINKLKSNGYTIVKKQHLGFFSFIPFALIKIFDKYFLKNKSSAKTKIQISDNILIKFLFYLEERLSNLYYPLGVRCFVVARKL